MEKARGLGIVFLTVLVAAILGGLFWVAAQNIDVAATVDQQGIVTVDPWQRSLDLLALAIPFFTTVLGYYFGARGADTARKDAESAREETKQAEAKVRDLMAAAPQDVVDQARSANPSLWA